MASGRASMRCSASASATFSELIGEFTAELLPARADPRHESPKARLPPRGRLHGELTGDGSTRPRRPAHRWHGLPRRRPRCRPARRCQNQPDSACSLPAHPRVGVKSHRRRICGTRSATRLAATHSSHSAAGDPRDSVLAPGLRRQGVDTIVHASPCTRSPAPCRQERR